MATKTRRFRQLIEAPEILIQPGIYDGFSARLAQQMGLQRAIADCVDFPVSADADTGYGNAINVFFTVRGCEAAGADGIMLEDQVWPKRCGHVAGKEVAAQ